MAMRVGTLIDIAKVCLLVSMLVLIAGCGHDGAERPQMPAALVPVMIHPIKPEDVPAIPKPLKRPRPKSLRAAADVLLAKVCEWAAYGIKADPLLRVSAGLQPTLWDVYPECRRSGGPAPHAKPD
jgi:hypothetical protein